MENPTTEIIRHAEAAAQALAATVKEMDGLVSSLAKVTPKSIQDSNSLNEIRDGLSKERSSLTILVMALTVLAAGFASDEGRARFGPETEGEGPTYRLKPSE